MIMDFMITIETGCIIEVIMIAMDNDIIMSMDIMMPMEFGVMLTNEIIKQIYFFNEVDPHSLTFVSINSLY